MYELISIFSGTFWVSRALMSRIITLKGLGHEEIEGRCFLLLQTDNAGHQR